MLLQDLIAIKLAPQGALEDGGDDAQWLFRRAADPVSIHMLLRASDTGKDGVTRFIASTGSVDRMGDIVEQSWRLAAYRANPVICYQHGEHVVGRGAAKINKEADRLEMDVTWDESEVNPIGMLMAHQHRNGFRRAGSVGFIPGKAVSRADLPKEDPRKAPDGADRWSAGYLFRFPELLEFSTVAVPANSAALQLGYHAQAAEDDRDEQIRRFVGESVAKSTAAILLDTIKDDDAVRREILSLIWGASAPAQAPKPTDLSALFTR